MDMGTVWLLVHYTILWIGSLAPGSCSEDVTRYTYMLVGHDSGSWMGMGSLLLEDMDGFGRLCYRRLNYRGTVARRRRGEKLNSSLANRGK
jgi:hypothetical protein